VTRALDWDGCSNVRDLGGIPLERGGETRRGAVARADSLRRLSDAGWEALADYGVTRIVDLRLPEELAQDAPRAIGVEVVHVSLVGDVDPLFHEHLAEHPDAESYWAWVYVWILENRRDRVAGALAALADADGSVVFHCAGGKDRTGIVAALTLRLAGASIDEVVSDYVFTKDISREWVAEAADERERAARVLLTSTPPEAMRRALEHLDGKLGGVEAYLLGAGLSAGQLTRLRDRLAAP